MRPTDCLRAVIMCDKVNVIVEAERITAQTILTRSNRIYVWILNNHCTFYYTCI